MYFDTLTLISLLVFLGALGAFAYSCLFRNCLSKESQSAKRHDDVTDRGRF